MSGGREGTAEKMAHLTGWEVNRGTKANKGVGLERWRKGSQGGKRRERNEKTEWKENHGRERRESIC